MALILFAFLSPSWYHNMVRWETKETKMVLIEIVSKRALDWKLFVLIKEENSIQFD